VVTRSIALRPWTSGRPQRSISATTIDLGVAALDASDLLKERAVAAAARLVELLEDLDEQMTGGPDPTLDLVALDRGG